MKLTPEDLPRAQRIAQLLLLKAVNVGAVFPEDLDAPALRALCKASGRSELNEVYQAIVERRDGPTAKARASYSSCGDLCHWLLRCLGVRADWLNRDDDNAGRPWVMGVNLNWLTPPGIGKCRPAEAKFQGAFEPGDVFVTNGSHALAVVHYDAERDILITAEYGQPGGLLKMREGTAGFVSKVTSHLRLADVLELCAADVDFAAFGDWATGEELDALEREAP